MVLSYGLCGRRFVGCFGLSGRGLALVPQSNRLGGLGLCPAECGGLVVENSRRCLERVGRREPLAGLVAELVGEFLGGRPFPGFAGVNSTQTVGCFTGAPGSCAQNASILFDCLGLAGNQGVKSWVSPSSAIVDRLEAGVVRHSAGGGFVDRAVCLGYAR